VENVVQTVNMFEAKSTLSRLVGAIERGEAQEIIIARHGRPAARLVPVEIKPPARHRIGVAKGLFTLPDTLDAHNDAVVALFTQA